MKSSDGEFQHEKITLLNCDCMGYMDGLEHNAFDLAVVDPPYGRGQHFNFRFGENVYDNTRPDSDYFLNIFRVSKEQIVWGGNYFTNDLPESRCWISWSKKQPLKTFSAFELAWTSFDRVCNEIRIDSYGFNHADKRINGEKTIHPTQKPVSLYKWIFANYAQSGQRILDTHLGSGSSAIAAHYAGLEFVGLELDTKYFNAAVERFKRETKQLEFLMERDV